MGTRALRERVTALRCGLDHTNWREGQESREICKKLLNTEVPEDRQPPFDAAAAHALYRDLFGGVEDLIKDKSLLIVPSGALTQLPFEALVTEKPDEDLPRFEAYKSARWLGQRQAVTVLPSVGSLKALRTAKGSAATEPVRRLRQSASGWRGRQGQERLGQADLREIPGAGANAHREPRRRLSLDLPGRAGERGGFAPSAAAARDGG